MSIQVKLRRGTTSQHSTFTGAEGEVTIDTDKDVVVVHDGTTVGGHPMVKASSLATVATTGDYNDLLNKPSAGLGSVTSVALTAPVGFSVSGSPVTTSGTLALSFDTGYSLPTNTKQSQWDTAYSWGNHATAGYLTSYTETDPIFSSHPAHNVTSTNLTEWAAAYNDKVNSASFDTATGVLSLNQQDGGVVTVDLDGRYLTSETDSQNLSWNGATGELSISNGNTVDLDGRYLTSYTETDPIVGAVDGLVKSNGSGSISAAIAGTDYLAPSAIGTTVQAYDADLTAWASVATSSKQDTLVSGTNIKTINGNSLLGSGDLVISGGGGSGTVTSVGLSLPSIFDVSGSPVTTSGTLTGTLASQTANKVFASPNGASGTPSFRSLVAADIPTLNQNTTGTAANVTGVVAIANGGTGQTTANAAFNALVPSQSGQSGKFLTTDGTNTSWATVSGGGSAISVSDEGTQITAGVTSLNFTGAGVTATASGNDVTLAITSGGISSADIQEFSTVGTSTWTKPAGAKTVHVVIFGGGGGGGSGRRRATGSIATAAWGGGAGGGGGRAEFWLSASALGSTESVVVGAGGTGGIARTVDDSTGANGGAGSASSFGSFSVRGGGSGVGGSASSGSGGLGGGSLGEFASANTTYSSTGGGGNSGAGAVGNRGGLRPGGGGGGGGFGASFATAFAGGGGALGGAILLSTNTLTTGGGGSLGPADSTTPGGAGANAPEYILGGSGGGGGGSGTSVSGSGSAGGAGGYPGGGGGGGGAGHGVDSGAGGDGGNGYVRVTTYF